MMQYSSTLLLNANKKLLQLKLIWKNHCINIITNPFIDMSFSFATEWDNIDWILDSMPTKLSLTILIAYRDSIQSKTKQSNPITIKLHEWLNQQIHRLIFLPLNDDHPFSSDMHHDILSNYLMKAEDMEVTGEGEKIQHVTKHWCGTCSWQTILPSWNDGVISSALLFVRIQVYVIS